MLLRQQLFACLIGALAVLSPTLAAFGTSISGSLLSVDTGGGLVFKVHTGNGDIRSIVYAGKELQDQAKFSHIASGFGTATVTYRTVNDQYIVVTSQSSVIGGTITQYFVAKKGDATIYMATHATAIPTVGELRFIYRLNRASVDRGTTASDVRGCDTVVEGSDVFKCADGSIRTKFFSSKQFIDDQVHGVTGNGVGAWMVLPGTAYEHSSGGPFFRDIDNQGAADQQVYFYMFSGHMQTEASRPGLSGPYALVINTGSTPSSDLDTSFFDGLGITGYFSAAQRGRISGTASGIGASYAGQQVVGWSSAAQQYWVRADSSGRFTSPLMIPGTYTQTLYKSEMAVGTVSSVTVTAGSTKTQNIASSEAAITPIWSFGERDGTPRGFYFADKIERTHPTIGNWPKLTLTAGSSPVSSFPMALWQGQNQPLTIKYTLTAAQVKASTVEVGITSSFAGGRPTVAVNGVAGAVPDAPIKIDSRGVSRGSWRGRNQAFIFPVAASTLKAGENTLTISVASGSAASDWWLSPNFVFDYLRFF